jgi:hypothetical protein
VKEAEIEMALLRGMDAQGGLCLKFTSPGRRGVPDRVCIMPRGQTYWVELKRPKGGVISGPQQRLHDQFMVRGHRVHVLWTLQQVAAFLAEIQK